MSRKILVMFWQPDVEQTARLSLEQKLCVLKQVFNQAYRHFQAYSQNSNHQKSTLLFIAPEYYFVGQHFYAYSETQKQFIQTQLTEWSQNTPHCILIPGTIKWRQLTQPHSPAHRDAINAFETIGFQYYKNLKQNPLLQPAWHYTLAAQERCFIFNSSLIIHQGACYEYHKQTAANELNETERHHAAFRFGTQSAFLEIDGLRFGLEICSDHDHRLLRKHLEKGLSAVDIHIVQSKGLPSLVDAIACHPDGLYVHCDHFACYNSLVLSFQQGIGQETPAIGKHPEHGLIWWEVNVTPMSPTEQHTSKFAELSIASLRKEVRVIDSEHSQQCIKRI